MRLLLAIVLLVISLTLIGLSLVQAFGEDSVLERYLGKATPVVVLPCVLAGWIGLRMLIMPRRNVVK